MAATPLAIAVGVTAALLSISSFAPQIIKICRDRDASSISRTAYLVTVAGFVCWTLYGVLIGAWPVVAANLACLAMSSAVLALKWRLDRKAGRPL